MKQKNTILIFSLFLATSLLHAMDDFYGSPTGWLTYNQYTSNGPIKPTSPLFKAIYSHDINTIKKLITKGADVHEKDHNEVTFLWKLIDYRKHFKQQDIIEIINLLLQKGIDLNTPGCRVGATTLYQLFKIEDVPLVDKCIKWGAQVNVKSYCGNTPLHKASEKNKKHAVALLLFYNADHEMKNNRNETAYDYGNRLSTVLADNSEATAILKNRKSVRKTVMPLIQEKEFCGNKIYSALKKREYTGSHRSIKKGVTPLPILPQ